MGYWRGKLWSGMCAGFTLLWLAAYVYGAGPATASQEPPRQPDAALIDDYLGHIRAGVSAYHAQRFADATQAFEAAAVLRPSASVVYRYLAELYWRAGRPEQARQAVHTLAGLISDAY